jgi:hypothetical protein
MTNRKIPLLLIGTLCATLTLAATAAFGGQVRDRHAAGGYVVDTGADAGRYTCTLDIPWDWPHRCPPLAPARPPAPPVAVPYAPPCPAQTVRVPTGDGGERTVSIVRC